MYSKFKIRSIASTLMMSATAAFLLGSCTVYKYADPAQEDGIYSSNRNYRGNTTENYSPSNNYYKQYFQSKKGNYAALLAEDEDQSAIFTDVEAYHSKDYVGEDGYIYTEDIEYEEEQYAGWGNNPTSVTINMYNSGYNYGYGGYYSPWGYNSYYGYWGYPYYNYRPWRIGFGIGFGFGYGYGWGGGYYSPFYTPYYGNYYRPYYPHYNNNYVSYNRGRRNTDYIGRNNNQTYVNRGRSSSSSTISNGGRGSSNTGYSTRENGTVNRRDASINRGQTARENTYNRAANNTQVRRANFPGSNNTTNRTQQQQTTRRQPTNTTTRPTQSWRDASYNNQQNRNTNMRSTSPTRSPSNMQSSPSRGSYSPSSGGGGGGGGARGRG